MCDCDGRGGGGGAHLHRGEGVDDWGGVIPERWCSAAERDSVIPARKSFSTRFICV